MNRLHRRILLLLLSMIIAGAIPVAWVHGQTGQSAGTSIYLPLVIGGGSTAPPPDFGTGAAGALFVERTITSASAVSAVDAQHGWHMAYAQYGSGSHPAWYAYCANRPAAACADPAAWQRVALGDYVDEVQLALTPAGAPRMLLSVSRSQAEGEFGTIFVYAACDRSCDAAASWSLTRVAETSYSDVQQFDMPQHWFALDPQGRPRFIYRKQYIMQELGTMYVACDSGCDDAAGWSETAISLGDEYQQDIFTLPALAFSSSGQPRIISGMIPVQGDEGVYYLACDDDCMQHSNWQRVRLLERGQGPAALWDIALTSADQPRIAVYQEDTADGGNALIYAWCDADCLDDQSWLGTSLDLGAGEGQQADLALDTLNRPRIAYRSGSGSGLAYTWCDSGCEEAGALWQARLMDADSDLDRDLPLPVPPACEQAAWSGGHRPALSLDAAGNPRIASDALRLMRCRYQDPTDPTRIETRIETYRYTRFTFAAAGLAAEYEYRPGDIA